MTLLPLNGFLMAGVSLVCLIVIIYWWTVTRGSWIHWPAGRSLMGLLAILAIITGWASLNVLVLPAAYPGKVEGYLALYAVMLSALVGIGFTIRNEMRRGKKKLLEKNPDNPSGPVSVIVATENKETPEAE